MRSLKTSSALLILYGCSLVGVLIVWGILTPPTPGDEIGWFVSCLGGAFGLWLTGLIAWFAQQRRPRTLLWPLITMAVFLCLMAIGMLS